jgi:hypothetical protein
MFNPADLTPENIAKLAEKMRDPAVRQKAAFHLANTVGPSPDEQDQIQAMMNPQQQPQEQAPQQVAQAQQMPPQMPPQLPPQLSPPVQEMAPEPMSPPIDPQQQDAAQQMQQQTQEKMQAAMEYDKLGLQGAAPNDYWGKAAIYYEYLDKMQAQQLQQMMMQPQQGMPMPGGGGGMLPTEPVRQTSPQQNVSNYMNVGGQ